MLFMKNNLLMYAYLLIKLKVADIQFIHILALTFLQGNGRKLVHNADSVFASTAEKDVSVLFLERYWYKHTKDRSDIPTLERASREDLMMVLVNLEQILLKYVWYLKK